MDLHNLKHLQTVSLLLRNIKSKRESSNKPKIFLCVYWVKISIHCASSASGTVNNLVRDVRDADCSSLLSVGLRAWVVNSCRISNWMRWCDRALPIVQPFIYSFHWIPLGCTFNPNSHRHSSTFKASASTISSQICSWFQSSVIYACFPSTPSHHNLRF